MANKQIHELPEASSLGDNDVFLIEQSGTAKKVKKQTVDSYILDDDSMGKIKFTVVSTW